MYAIEKEILVCAHCQAEVQATDAYCPRCGTLFEEDHWCVQHHGIVARAVCIVCGEACCEQCGAWHNERFLCQKHFSLMNKTMIS